MRFAILALIAIGFIANQNCENLPSNVQSNPGADEQSASSQSVVEERPDSHFQRELMSGNGGAYGGKPEVFDRIATNTECPSGADAYSGDKAVFARVTVVGDEGFKVMDECRSIDPVVVSFERRGDHQVIVDGVVYSNNTRASDDAREYYQDVFEDTFDGVLDFTPDESQPDQTDESQPDQNPDTNLDDKGPIRPGADYQTIGEAATIVECQLQRASMLALLDLYRNILAVNLCQKGGSCGDHCIPSVDADCETHGDSEKYGSCVAF